MFVFDLDQTLLRDDKTISDYTIDIIESLSAKYILCIATGRAKPRANKCLNLINASYLIALNGAMIYQFDNLIYSYPVNPNLVKDMLDEISSMKNVKITVSYPEFSLTNDLDYIDNINSHMLTEETFIADEIQKIFVITKEEYRFETIDLSKYECKFVKDSTIPNCYIISNYKVDKLFGVKQICSRENISLDEVVSFGDDYNDMELMKESGYSIAVKNACNAVKSIANECTLSNNDDGVAKWIENNMER